MEDRLVAFAPWIVALLTLGLTVLRGGRWLGGADEQARTTQHWREEIQAKADLVLVLEEQIKELGRRTLLINGLSVWQINADRERARLEARLEHNHEKHQAQIQKNYEAVVLYIDRVEARLIEALRQHCDQETGRP